MAPSQTLKWIEQGKDPSEQSVEIEGTEPYIVGGHTASGYWVNTNRETTIHGLYAAGDVAGGCPQKYVTGALVEGELAALDIVEKLKDQTFDITDNKEEQLLDEKSKNTTIFYQTKTVFLRSSKWKKRCRKSWMLMQAEFQVIISLMKTA